MLRHIRLPLNEGKVQSSAIFSIHHRHFVVRLKDYGELSISVLYLRIAQISMHCDTFVHLSHHSIDMKVPVHKIYQFISVGCIHEGCQNSADLRKSTDLAGSGSGFPD